MADRIPVGTEVRYTLDGWAYRTLVGTVLAYVPAGTPMDEAWPEVKTIPKARRHWSHWVSSVDRYVVQVPLGRNGVPHYYAPRADVLERAWRE